MFSAGSRAAESKRASRPFFRSPKRRTHTESLPDAERAASYCCALPIECERSRIVAPLIDTFPWFAFAAAFGIVGAVLVLLGIGALVRRRPFRFVVRTLAGLLLVAIGTLAGAI